MVAEGVDGAPRDWGELGDECVGKLICPAVGDDLWREIVANTLGWVASQTGLIRLGIERALF